MYQWCEFKSRRGKNKNLTALKSNSNTVWFNFQTYIYIKKSNEIHMLVHIKEISKKRTRRIFHNILVLTFSLLLQIFRYNVYKCIYCTWRSATAVKTLVQECCEKSVLFFFLLISLIYIYIYYVKLRFIKVYGAASTVCKLRITFKLS